MKIDLERFRAQEEAGYVTCRKHRETDLYIWNYTSLCQFEQAWNEVTMRARGLITNSDGEIVALPFRKFFNFEQVQDRIPNEPFQVTAKMDGSLGISYWLDGEMFIATRGSFESDQAIRATSILRRYRDFAFDPEYTYLFEIIYPKNRIVVNYGNQEDLILLAMIHTKTGKEIDIHALDIPFPMPVVRCYSDVKKIEELFGIEEQNAEGFVVRFQNGFRMKIKFSDYIRLHRILTQCTLRTIWDLLRNNQSFDELLDRVPDEFYAGVRQAKEELLARYVEIEQQAVKLFHQVKTLPTRKEQAAIVLQSEYSDIVFAMLDGKQYAEKIWKRLYPEATKLVAIEEDA